MVSHRLGPSAANLRHTKARGCCSAAELAAARRVHAFESTLNTPRQRHVEQHRAYIHNESWVNTPNTTCTDGQRLRARDGNNRNNLTSLRLRVGELRERLIKSVVSTPFPLRRTFRFSRTLSRARTSFSWIVRSWTAMHALSVSICIQGVPALDLRVRHVWVTFLFQFYVSYTIAFKV